MLCLNYKTKIEFFCWIRSRIEENKWVQKRSCLVHSRQLLYLLLTYVYSMSCYTFFLLVPRATCRRHVLCFYVIPFHTFFSGMPSLFQLANPFLPCRFSGGGNAELLQEYPATSPIIVSSVFFLKVNNPFYVRWNLTANRQPSVVFGL